jgi:4'-phosphopantetheinyl transferase
MFTARLLDHAAPVNAYYKQFRRQRLGVTGHLKVFDLHIRRERVLLNLSNRQTPPNGNRASMIDISATKILSHADDAVFNELVNFLSKSKRGRVARIRSGSDARSTLIGEVLARIAICNRLHLNNEELHLSLNRYGRPFFRNAENVCFSISHSGEWVVCATGNSPIGIDIELVRPLDCAGIAKRFFSIYEYDTFVSIDEQERLPHFFELWTLRESYIKFLGKGLLAPMRSFSLRTVGENAIVETENRPKNVKLRRYQIDTTYKMAVCAAKGEFPELVSVREPHELLAEMKKVTEAGKVRHDWQVLSSRIL